MIARSLLQSSVNFHLGMWSRILAYKQNLSYNEKAAIKKCIKFPGVARSRYLVTQAVALAQALVRRGLGGAIAPYFCQDGFLDSLKRGGSSSKSSEN